MNLRILAVSVYLALAAYAFGAFESPFRVENQSIVAVFGEAKSLKQSWDEVSRESLEQYDQVRLALNRLTKSPETPAWMKQPGLYAVEFSEKERKILIRFSADTDVEKTEAFSRIFQQFFARVRIDAALLEVEAVQAELEALRREADAEQDSVRRDLLNALLDRKSRVMRDTPMCGPM